MIATRNLNFSENAAAERYGAHGVVDHATAGELVMTKNFAKPFF